MSQPTWQQTPRKLTSTREFTRIVFVAFAILLVTVIVLTVMVALRHGNQRKVDELQARVHAVLEAPTSLLSGQTTLRDSETRVLFDGVFFADHSTAHTTVTVGETTVNTIADVRYTRFEGDPLSWSALGMTGGERYTGWASGTSATIFTHPVLPPLVNLHSVDKLTPDDFDADGWASLPDCDVQASVGDDHELLLRADGAYWQLTPANTSDTWDSVEPMAKQAAASRTAIAEGSGQLRLAVPMDPAPPADAGEHPEGEEPPADGEPAPAEGEGEPGPADGAPDAPQPE